MSELVQCPICSKLVQEAAINTHIDSSCASPIADQSSQSKHGVHPSPPPTQLNGSSLINGVSKTSSQSFFAPQSSASKTSITPLQKQGIVSESLTTPSRPATKHVRDQDNDDGPSTANEPLSKKHKTSSVLEKVAPLAERMRPTTLEEIHGQPLLSPDGLLYNLIQSDNVPSMILWGGPGTGKTTIARIVASHTKSRFVEINSTSSGVSECKRLFSEARSELSLTGRKTILFCDEIHRFTKAQQDVFLAPVEAGIITLVGATTENPSFKVINALLSRCRTFVLDKLTKEHIRAILLHAVNKEMLSDDAKILIQQDEHALLDYLASFADGDARTALNLLSLAIDLAKNPDMTLAKLQDSLTQTMVYDRAGDQHYDSISAFHKSVRGSDANAALYYLARMLQSGEDPLYIARRMVVISSEDIGLADNSMLSLATATYSAAEKIGMPECRINLGHCAVALCLAPKSTRAYRGLNAAYDILKQPGVAGLPIPVHLRNAPTRLMKELGYGVQYKYNPDYVDGKVKQEYLPEQLSDKQFLSDADFGDSVDDELQATSYRAY